MAGKFYHCFHRWLVNFIIVSIKWLVNFTIVSLKCHIYKKMTLLTFVLAIPLELAKSLQKPSPASKFTAIDTHGIHTGCHGCPRDIHGIPTGYPRDIHGIPTGCHGCPHFAPFPLGTLSMPGINPVGYRNIFFFPLLTPKWRPGYFGWNCISFLITTPIFATNALRIVFLKYYTNICH